MRYNAAKSSQQVISNRLRLEIRPERTNSQWQAQPVAANCMTSRTLGEISKRSPSRLTSDRSAAGSQIGDGNPDGIPTRTKAISKPTPAPLGVAREWELRKFGRSISPKRQPKRLTMKAPRAPRKTLSKPMTISRSTFRLFRLHCWGQVFIFHFSQSSVDPTAGDLPPA